MSIQSDIDDAAATLVTAIQAYMAAGGRTEAVTQFLISKLRTSDPRIARMLEHSGNRFLTNAVDYRPFTTIG
jgi:hypothetical protein